MRETSSSNYSPVRRAQSFPNNKTAYEQIKLEDQQSHAQAFVKLNKNAPYAAGQMNKLWKKKINLSNYCLSPCCRSGATPDRRGQMRRTAEGEESDNFMFR